MASKLSVFFAELKRRKVYRVAAIYAAVGIAISLGVPDLFGALLLPDWAARLVIVLIAIGFPLALVLAWALELTPEGFRLDRPAIAGEEGREDPRPSLAVLPFTSLSEEPENEFFSVGVTDDILTRLTAVGGLRVISRTSVMRYRAADKSIPEIAQELGVRNILEGSVRRAENRVRVVAQLIDAKTDEHLWADSYDRDLEDVFRVQTDVAENIAHALRAELTTEERDRVRRIPTENLEAYDLFVRAVSACQGMLPGDLAKAVEYCQEAIRLDPGFAQAYAMLAQFHVLAGFYANQRPSDLFPKVREAASRALELDPQCGEAHTAMAVFKIQYERDSEGIEEELARALELNPDDSFAYFWKATHLLCRGHFAEAEGVMRQGLVSDPLSPLVHHDLGQLLALGGKADEAIQVLESAVRHWPDLSLLHLWLGLSHLYVSEPESALSHFETAVELSGPLPFFESVRGVGLAAVGRVAEAREVLEDLEARSRSEYVDPYNLFNLTVSLDGFDAAAPYLDEALQARSFFLPYLGVIPRYRPLHSDPRFRAVLDTVWPGVSFEG